MGPISLNALSGIGGVQTSGPGEAIGHSSSVLMPCRALEAFRLRARRREAEVQSQVLMPCRALEAFRLTRTPASSRSCKVSLNALSGIGGVQTDGGLPAGRRPSCVLMPCRALEAFRLALSAFKSGVWASQS